MLNLSWWITTELSSTGCTSGSLYSWRRQEQRLWMCTFTPFLLLFQRNSHDNLLLCVTFPCQNAAELKPPRSNLENNEHEFHKSPTVHIHLHSLAVVNQRSRDCDYSSGQDAEIFFCTFYFYNVFIQLCKIHLLHRDTINQDLSLSSSIVWEIDVEGMTDPGDSLLLAITRGNVGITRLIFIVRSLHFHLSEPGMKMHSCYRTSSLSIAYVV